MTVFDETYGQLDERGRLERWLSFMGFNRKNSLWENRSLSTTVQIDNDGQATIKCNNGNLCNCVPLEKVRIVVSRIFNNLDSLKE